MINNAVGANADLQTHFIDSGVLNEIPRLMARLLGKLKQLLCQCQCVYVYVCMCMCVCVYVYVCMYIYMCFSVDLLILREKTFVLLRGCGFLFSMVRS